eukprot:1278487-Pyramimonas_sp.AAC.1
MMGALSSGHPASNMREFSTDIFADENDAAACVALVRNAPKPRTPCISWRRRSDSFRGGLVSWRQAT